MTRKILAPALAAPLVFALACGVEAPLETVGSDDPTTSQLDQSLGGMDEADEAPMFGDSSFALLSEDVEDPDAGEAHTDETASGSQASTAATPDVWRISLTMIWGKLRLDPNWTDVTRWSGRLVADGAAITRVRTIRFEDHDRLLPRRSRGEVRWRSATGPHHDGVHVMLAVPMQRTSTVPPTLTYEVMGRPIVIPIRNLVHLQSITPVGDNFLAINSFVVRPDDCASGWMRGHWFEPDERGVGRFIGRWMGEGGAVRGFLRGVYGTRANGDSVFYAKIIDRQGRYIGVMGGRYQSGHLAGRFRLRNGDVGALRGRYADQPNQPGGLFIARWAELCEPSRTTIPTENLPPLE